MFVISVPVEIIDAVSDANTSEEACRIVDEWLSSQVLTAQQIVGQIRTPDEQLSLTLWGGYGISHKKGKAYL